MARLRKATPPVHRPRSTTAHERYLWIAAIVTAVAVVLAIQVAWPIPVVPPGAMMDDVQYLEIAQSIRAGHYAITGLLSRPVPEIHFPPLFPLWLVGVDVVGRLTGHAPWDTAFLLAAQRGLAALSAGIWVAVAATWTRTRDAARLALPPTGTARAASAWTPLLACVSMILAAALPISRILAATLMSEHLAAVWIGACIVALRFAAHDFTHAAASGALPTRTQTWRIGMAAGALGTGLLIRNAWAPLVLAILAAEGWMIGRSWYTQQRRADAPRRDASGIPRRLVLAAYASLVPAVAWGAWGLAQRHAVPMALGSGYGTYAQILGEGLHRSDGLRGLLLVQWLQATRFANDLFGGWTGTAIAGVSTAAGATLAFPMGWVLVVGFEGVIAMLVLWPFTPDRFLMSFAPAVGICVAMALSTLLTTPASDRRRRWLLRVAGVNAAILVATPMVRHIGRGYTNGSFDHGLQAQTEDAQPLVAWARTAPDSLGPLFSRYDYLVRWHASRQSLPIPAFRADWYGARPTATAMAAAFVPSLCLVPHGTVVYASADTDLRDAMTILADAPPEGLQIGPLVTVDATVSFQRVDCATGAR